MLSVARVPTLPPLVVGQRRAAYSDSLEADRTALDLVHTYASGDQRRFEAAARAASVPVVVALIRLAQPSYSRQFRTGVISALAGGTVTSAITWTMAGHPRSQAKKRERLFKTLRNAAIGVAVSTMLSVAFYSRSPERDALRALKKMDSEKVGAAEAMIAAGFETPLLPAIQPQPQPPQPQTLPQRVQV